MSVIVVGHRTGIMPMEILNLGEKIYIVSLFTNEKSHLLRNVIYEIICHQGSNNDLERLQPLLQEQYNKERNTLSVTCI